MRGLEMERLSAGKRGEEKESVPDRGERELRGRQCTGELVRYFRTDPRVTKRRRVFLWLALET